MNGLRSFCTIHICSSVVVSKFASRIFYHTSQAMAKSKYEYVKAFENDDKLLLNCWIVVRIDGKGFHKFADLHDFSKPNDKRALDLMNKCATIVMDNFHDVILSFGQSDEYSFIFRKDTALYGRRSSKIMTTVNSLFSSAYVYHWGDYFGSVKLQYPPSFDARTVLYPSDNNIRDYLCWRQADVHINNLYNLAFWSLVLHKDMTTAQAQERLRGTLSSHKNEILFSEFGINYNNEPAMFRKGTALLRKSVHIGDDCGKLRKNVLPFFCDFFQESFWRENPEILGERPLPVHYASFKENTDSPFSVCVNSQAIVSEISSATLSNVDRKEHSTHSDESNKMKENLSSSPGKIENKTLEV